MLDPQQQIQSDQYDFPYHFLPIFEANKVRLTRQWNWAPSYIAALHIVADWMKSLDAGSIGPWRHLDVGCGDGALIFHLRHAFSDRPQVQWSGIDFDESAIGWARAMNGPYADFTQGDIADFEADSCDSASLIEVAEHIPPPDLPAFVQAIYNALKPGSQLLLTVPHANKGVQPKHYQHFTFEAAQEVFCGPFELVAIGGFERHTQISRLLQRLIINRHYVFTWEPPTSVIINQLRKIYESEAGIGRVRMVLRKPR